MDAVKFLKEYDRMCGLYNKERCAGCPLQNNVCAFYPLDELDNIVQVVEKWSAEHPVKTRLMDFLEKHPDAPLYEYDEGEFPMMCPSVLGYCGNGSTSPCCDCPYDEEPETFCWNLPLEVR